MNEEALRYLDQSDGWEIGVGPSVVVVDEGLMAGLGIQGNKITRVDKR